jgi:hypothetical protein
MKQNDPKYQEWKVTHQCKINNKATNNMLPYTMSKGIVKKRCSGYSLRGLRALIIPRFNTRYMKDSVEYRGSVLWNFVHYNEQGVEHHQPKYLKEQLR